MPGYALYAVNAVSKVDKFSDIASAALRVQHYLMLSRGNFYAKNSIVAKFCHLALGRPVIMPQRVDMIVLHI